MRSGVEARGLRVLDEPADERRQGAGDVRVTECPRGRERVAG